MVSADFYQIDIVNQHNHQARAGKNNPEIYSIDFQSGGKEYVCNHCYNPCDRKSDDFERSFNDPIGWVLDNLCILVIWMSFFLLLFLNLIKFDDAGAFLASAKGVKPEERGDILLHDTDLLLAHNKVAR